MLCGLSFVLLAPGFSAAEVLTNETIVTMVKAGFGEELIISKIKISQGQYDLSMNALLKLKNDGVSEKIIQAMMGASAKPESPEPGTAQAEAPHPASAQEEQEAIALYRKGKRAEAAAAFDKLLAEKPNDDGLRIWKALALLKQAGEMKESKVSGYKPVVLKAWAILQPMGQRQATNPDWNFAAAKALWLNDRAERAGRVVQRALAVRPNFAEAHLLLGDMAYDEAVTHPTADLTTRWRSGLEIRKRYEMVLALPDLTPELRAEALFKMGMVSTEFENKKELAREYWGQAAAADPASRYGRMAQEKLKAASSK
jgi:tetratricopeptide (TPR) repeat protein